MYKIPHTTADTFRLLVEYFYSYNLHTLYTCSNSRYRDGLSPKQYSKEQIKTVKSEAKAQIRDLIRLWYLADYLIMPKLQNLVTVMLGRGFKWFNRGPCPKFVCEAEEEAMDSMLWRFTRDSFAWRMNVDIPKHNVLLKLLPPEAWLQLFVASKRQRKHGKEPDCNYYFVKED